MLIAAQLYVFNNAADAAVAMPDWLEALSDAGYGAVEGMYGRPPADRAAVDAAGLRYLATHVVPGQLEPGDELIAFVRQMGATRLCSSGPLEWEARTVDDFRRTADHLNAAGRRLCNDGLHLCYHNHGFEFVPWEDGRLPIDVLLNALDPAAVELCLDTGWVEVAGCDPVAFLRDHGDRIGLLHIRDFRGTESVPLGRGECDLGAVALNLPGLDNMAALVVEQDPTTDTPLEDMKASIRYLHEELNL